MIKVLTGIGSGITMADGVADKMLLEETTKEPQPKEKEGPSAIGGKEE